MRFLEIDGLTVSSPAGDLVRDLSFSLEHGGALGLVGGSGAGKSLSALALCGLLPRPLWVRTGEIRLNGEIVPPNDPHAWRARRGRQIFLMFQSPASALNPVVKVGPQIAEALGETRGRYCRRARERVGRLLESVGLPASYAGRYPFELSGGMRQRVLAATALALRPLVLIADEPTTGLDPLNQMAVLDLLQRLRREHRTALILISHDLRAISALVPQIVVMQHGRVVERGITSEVLARPTHSHTRELVEALHLLGGRHG
ncbi:MAG: ABC transporter ATP-binding protein [Desulfacinum sp.]|jgi:ABC-type glutathione transport system ATPase component|nr:ABC transporter ATP-binding protein [Desulfacinum sp.]MBZ4658557.1 transporter related protein [Desulfacinum sp.]